MRIAPVLIAGLDRAWARHETPYGMAEAGWTASAGQVQVRAVVPANTTAIIVLPGAEPVEVGSGLHEWTVSDPRPAQEESSLTTV
ncbi:alpha-L-rhamnosidase C-terminal domain-containing protein [Arthrobacter sp. ATA002]|uniref:alpha-L-rhamnosidase C-terminal domain-containing protein n=1 Tax=Arthrobacter sp. ATA002 TaxID=2991715 RepID=UPI002E2FFCD2|nr:alpha-L-rhamnosidase C-terminal domain-containing protein [Arthrobacter sp. ATA002]